MGQLKTPPPATTSHEVMLEIDSLLDEMLALAKSNCTAEEFFPPVLDRSVFAVTGRAGGIWLADPTGDLQLIYHQGLESLLKTKSRSALAALTQNLVAKLKAGAPLVIEPDKAYGAAEAWLFAPVDVDGRKWGVLALQIPADVPQSSHDGLLRFAVEVAHIVATYVRRQETIAFRRSLDDFSRFASFSLAAHRYSQKLDVAYEIVNEGRRYVGCDRVAMATVGVGRSRVIAVSGVEKVNRRTNLVSRLERLVSNAVRLGEPFIYQDGDADMPPQLEKCLHQYLDESSIRSLAIFPLRPWSHENDPSVKPVGAIVYEQFRGDGIKDLLPKINLASKHAALAWSRATGAAASGGFHWNSLLAKLGVVALVVAAACWLLARPADFEIVVRGQMNPRVERNLFSPLDGFIDQVLVEPGQTVKPGQVLATINSSDLELQMKRVNGDIQTAHKRLASIVAERLQLSNSNKDFAIAESRLTGEELSVKEVLRNLELQMKILERQNEKLSIEAPISGYVMSWELEKKLQSRPVRRGDKLLSVCDLDGEWLLEFDVPDESLGHILKAQKEHSRALPLRFVTAMTPDAPRQGRVTKIAPVSQATGQDSHRVVRVEATFDRESVPQVVPGATVIGRIYCGQRSLAYVWLHEFREEIYRFFF